jgi:nitrile hydratase
MSMHDGWVYPDTNAHGRGESPQHLYTVAFGGDELWGAGAETGVVVHLDLFEPYLERSDD